MRSREEIVAGLLADPERLLMKKPFTRGMDIEPSVSDRLHNILSGKSVEIGGMTRARLPRVRLYTVTQEQFAAELDPDCHKVLFDQNIPSITMKLQDGSWATIEYKKMSVPFQRMIKNKHVLHLCGNPVQFTLVEENPTEDMEKDFALFKQYWAKRNQDGMRTKMVDAQMSYGDAGLLYYFNHSGQVRSRLISFKDGFVLCPHNDDNGDRVLESIYYCSDGVEYIDSYDDRYMYRMRSAATDETAPEDGWIREEPVLHGFSEIPLVTKRGDVAWNAVQNIIEVYEVIYNIFMVIQKRHGWGILYVKGTFRDEGRKIAGAIVLNDTSPGEGGSADFKTPPSPQGMIDTMDLLEETIQKGSGTTFLLPKDVKISSDISGTAIQLTQSLDNETALFGAIEWKNVADKMCRLFKEGLSKELVNTRERDFALSDFNRLNISASFKEWKPRSDNEYNQMLVQLLGSGMISKKTAIQKNTESVPDEAMRISEEDAEAERKALEIAGHAISDNTTGDSGDSDDEQADDNTEDTGINQ